MEGDGEFKGGTRTGLRLYPYFSAQALHDLFADGQANAVSGILRAQVQALEDHENVFRELGRNSNSVIGYAKQPLLAGFLRVYENLRRFCPAELDGVPNQILEHLRHLRAIAPDGGKVCMREDGVALLNRGSQALPDFFHHRIAIDTRISGIGAP